MQWEIAMEHLQSIGSSLKKLLECKADLSGSSGITDLIKEWPMEAPALHTVEILAKQNMMATSVATD